MMEMKEIPLTQGKIALVDDEDYTSLSCFNWHCSHGYARRGIGQHKGRRMAVLMHRVIADKVFNGIPVNCEVDHVDRNTLNNQRHNLRLCTHRQNGKNVSNSKSSSGFRGVRKRNKKWAAQIACDGTLKHLGTFDTAEAAAEAYDVAAQELHGEFAVLNCPDCISVDAFLRKG